MKYTKLIAILVLLWASSCQKVIDLSPPSEMNEADFYQNADDIESAVNACYSSLQLEGQYGLNFVFLMEIRSDNATLEDFSKSGARYGDIETFNESTANPVIEQAWRDSYKCIQRCNIILSRVDAIEMSEGVKSMRKGEVAFLRALTYFNLVRLWGDVPLITDEIEDPFSSFGTARTDKDIVYEQIITDLEYATSVLPAVSLDAGRVTSGAAESLLGKVYLTLGKYVEASTHLENVIAQGNYRLLDEFAEVFATENENSSEIIFSVQYKGGSEGEGSVYTNQFAPQGATGLVGGIGKTSGDNIPTSSLYNSYTSKDIRLKASIGTYPDGRLYNKKYEGTPIIAGSSDNNFIVLRYADVLLMAAEALNEQGYNNSNAFKYLNMVGLRAGLDTVNTAQLTDQRSFREYIALERRRELAFENHRWFDLLRTQRAEEVMNKHVVFGTTLKMGAHQLVYPIPQRELNADPNGMKQNPGY